MRYAPIVLTGVIASGGLVGVASVHTHSAKADPAPSATVHSPGDKNAAKARTVKVAVRERSGKSAGNAAVATQDDAAQTTAQSGVVTAKSQNLDSFAMVGATLGSDVKPSDVQLRVRQNGTWGKWRTMTPDAQEGPDSAKKEGVKTSAKNVTAPIWVKKADAVEARVKGQPADSSSLKLTMVDPGKRAADKSTDPGTGYTDVNGEQQKDAAGGTKVEPTAPADDTMTKPSSGDVSKSSPSASASDGATKSGDAGSTDPKTGTDATSSTGTNTAVDATSSAATGSASDTASATGTGSASDTASTTGTATDTASKTGTATDSATGSASDTATGTASDTASATGTGSASDTASATGTASSTGTPSDTASSTAGGTGSSSGSASSSTASQAPSPIVKDVARPRIITRAEWGADESIVCPETDAAADTHQAVVHHTVDSNDYKTMGEAMQMIRADMTYHVKTNGWCDLGYNFVVDKWGNIYEGRRGSVETNRVGAHATGFNTGTVGIAMLGDYSKVKPTWATNRSIASVAAWKLGQYGYDPQGQVTETSGGGDKYPAGTSVTMPRIVAHRDVNKTECDGDGAYADLDLIRSVAALKAGFQDQDPAPTGTPTPVGTATSSTSGSASATTSGSASATGSDTASSSGSSTSGTTSPSSSSTTSGTASTSTGGSTSPSSDGATSATTSPSSDSTTSATTSPSSDSTSSSASTTSTGTATAGQ